MRLRKNLKALLLGYVAFDVNGERFAYYFDAQKRRVELWNDPDVLRVVFSGFCVYKGWCSFFAGWKSH